MWGSFSVNVKSQKPPIFNACPAIWLQQVRFFVSVLFPITITMGEFARAYARDSHHLSFRRKDESLYFASTSTARAGS